MVSKAITLYVITKGKLYIEKRRVANTELWGIKKNQDKRLRRNSQ